MSDYWDLFAETGDIGFYLLYLKSAEEIAPPEAIGAADTQNDLKQLM
jgi:hypothetical protein